MRKSARAFIPSPALKYTLPPSPPSPPPGPPKGTNFSRRKLTEPRPPLPACTLSLASSTNFMEDYGAHSGLVQIRKRGGHIAAAADFITERAQILRPRLRGCACAAGAWSPAAPVELSFEQAAT